MGDATGTGGRPQELIPLQDESGNILSGAGGGGTSSGSKTGGLDVSELSKSLEQMQKIMEQNAAQVQTLAQSRMDKLQEILEENASQIRKLLEHGSATNKHVQELQDQNVSQLKELTSISSTISTEISSQLSTKFDSLIEASQKREMQSDTSSPCTHNVRPPPRKLDRKVVGYEYGQQRISSSTQSTSAKPVQKVTFRDVKMGNGDTKTAVNGTQERSKSTVDNGTRKSQKKQNGI